jgi:hypothetical protein
VKPKEDFVLVSKLAGVATLSEARVGVFTREKPTARKETLTVATKNAGISRAKPFVSQ